MLSTHTMVGGDAIFVSLGNLELQTQRDSKDEGGKGGVWMCVCGETMRWKEGKEKRLLGLEMEGRV